MTPLRINLCGHLTASVLQQEFRRLESELGTKRRSLVVDARQMTGYDEAARNLFVSWNAHHRNQILRVAIVTDKLLWRMVITAMSLAAQQDMRPFLNELEAWAWAANTPFNEEPLTVKVLAGRLIALKLYKISAAEIPFCLRRWSEACSEIPDGCIVVIADLRPIAELLPDRFERCTGLVRRLHIGSGRIASLIPSDGARRGFQIERMAKLVEEPNRRFFGKTIEAESWLGEVLTEPERKRLGEFVRDS